MSDRCAHCAKIVPWTSFWGNLSLGVYKLLVGLLGRSAALVADAVHSFADVIGSSGIVVATRISARDPDEQYPYGRGKAEFIGAVFVYTILLFFSGGIIVGAIRTMLSKNPQPPHFFTALGALISVFYNYIMYKYSRCVGRRNNSPAILADAFENRADAISSVACIVGIVAAVTINPICDALAALAVGLIILWNCQGQLREAARGLMDSGLPLRDTEHVREQVMSVAGVAKIAYLRSRQTGVRFWVDVGIEVQGQLAVKEADAIASAVCEAVQQIPECHHVEVYVLPAHGAPLPVGVVGQPAG